LAGKSNIAAMLLVALAALLIGFAASTLAYRFRILRVPGESVVNRMQRDLQLTPAQHSQIRDIMRDTRLKIMQDERDFRRKRHQAFVDAMHQIRTTLTPEQQAKFDQEFLPVEERFGRYRQDGALESQPSPSPTETPAQ
jgi:Spy/CpxP family protein refolding chaperone